MKDSIHAYFQVGTIQWMSHPRRDTMQSIRAIAADDYFDALEVTHFPDDRSRALARDIFAVSKLKPCYGAQPLLLGPKLNPNDLDEDGRQKAEDVLKRAVDEAAYLGAGGVAFLAGKWHVETREEAYAQLLKTTRAVCDYAAAKNILVELEVFDYDVDKATLIGPAPLAQRFAADMRMTNGNFGLLVDLSHFPITRESSQFVIRTLRPYITHFHIGNAVVREGYPAYGDAHPRFGFPNSSNDTAELLDFFRVLKQEGFFSAEKPYVLSFEVKPFGEEDEDLVLANCKRTINRAWALLED